MKFCRACFFFLPMITPCVFVCNFLEPHRLLDSFQVLAGVEGEGGGGMGGWSEACYISPIGNPGTVPRWRPVSARQLKPNVWWIPFWEEWCLLEGGVGMVVWVQVRVHTCGLALAALSETSWVPRSPFRKAMIWWGWVGSNYSLSSSRVLEKHLAFFFVTQSASHLSLILTCFQNTSV